MNPRRQKLLVGFGAALIAAPVGLWTQDLTPLDPDGLPRTEPLVPPDSNLSELLLPSPRLEIAGDSKQAIELDPQLHDPAVQRVIDALKSPPEPTVSLSLLAQLPSPSGKVVISLSEKRLRLMLGEAVALETTISCGAASAATPNGEFKVVRAENHPKGLDYGHIYAPKPSDKETGPLLIRGALAKRDAVPAGADFQPITPKVALYLSEGGPILFSGEGTGATTTHGCIIVPEAMMAQVVEKVASGTPVLIEP